MEKLVVALLCMLCAATCSAHRRHPHVQPLLRGPFPYCQPCPTPFTPPPPPPQREQNLAQVRPKNPLRQSYSFSYLQCPCVKPPGSKECATYDRRMQAATLEEALYSFPDLGKRASAGKAKPLFDASKEVQSLGESVQTEKVAPMAAGLGGPATLPMARFFGAAAPELDVAQTTQAPLSAAVASIALPAGEYSCNSPACKACLLSVVNGFIESGKNSADQATLAQFLSMQKQLEVESRGAQCPGLTPATAGFNVMASEAAPAAAKMAMASPPLPVPQEVITQIVKAIQPDGAAVKRRSTTDEEERTHEEAVAAEESEAHPQPRPQSRTRAKRQNGVPTSAAPTSNDRKLSFNLCTFFPSAVL